MRHFAFSDLFVSCFECDAHIEAYLERLLLNSNRIGSDFITLGNELASFHLPDKTTTGPMINKLLESGILTSDRYHSEHLYYGFLLPVGDAWYSNFVSGSLVDKQYRIRSLDDNAAQLHLHSAWNGNSLDRAKQITSILDQGQTIKSYDDAPYGAKLLIDQSISTFHHKKHPATIVLSVIQHLKDGGDIIHRFARNS